jgi:hypothetical protein
MSRYCYLYCLCVQVYSPPDIPVGLWKFAVESKPKDNLTAQAKVFTYPDKLYLLFNPWAKGKLIFMKIFLPLRYKERTYGILGSWVQISLETSAMIRSLMQGVQLVA